jgi:lipopolysaccharide/colanic/teichoic acid biosynthesis glycosyltransferase
MLSTADGVYRPVADVGAAERAWGYTRELIMVSPREQTESRAESTRRALNVVVALVAIVLLLPVFALIAIAIKLTSKGPVLYLQTRVGIDRRTGARGNWRRTVDYGGKLFTIYKFRTMRSLPAGTEQQVWASQNDPRITTIGKFLRKCRLDELPQLFNVLKGDMNIVGPRPEQPKIFLSLREKIEQYPERQRVLPGITGWAQVNLTYDRNLDDVRRKVQFDLEYAARQSAMEDLKIMLRTIPVVVFGRGAW